MSIVQILPSGSDGPHSKTDGRSYVQFQGRIFLQTIAANKCGPTLVQLVTWTKIENNDSCAKTIKSIKCE